MERRRKIVMGETQHSCAGDKNAREPIVQSAPRPHYSMAYLEAEFDEHECANQDEDFSRAARIVRKETEKK